ncbi:MAG: phosphate ABC transporter substrate-binding protein [Desulfobacteraceae bacterium]|nr:phosphate ABC transporter substrate-binding protein [Desulfobacteraceae bacterium]
MQVNRICITLYMGLACATLIAGMLISPALAEDNTSADIVWRGCGITQKAFMIEAAAAYEKITGKRISISGGGATLGIQTAASGQADIGGSCRPAKPDISELEKGVRMTHVGWDALVVMTHPDNPVNNITTEQLHKIMTGKIRNWSEIGGNNEQILVVVRIGKMSGVGYMGRKMLFQDPRENYYRRAINLKSSGPVEKKIESRKNAIGISGVSSAKRRKVKILFLDGTAPTKENVANASYPFFRPLFLMTKGEPVGEIKIFIQWLLSAEGQKVVSDQGTVNLTEGARLTKEYKFWENTQYVLNFTTEKEGLAQR